MNSKEHDRINDVTDLVANADGTYEVSPEEGEQSCDGSGAAVGKASFVPEVVQADLFDDDDSRRSFHEKALVYKRNELVHGHIRMSAASQKVLATVISMINPLSEDGVPRFKFGVPEFAAICGVSPQYVYKTIRDITIELQGKVLTVPKIYFEYEEAVRLEKKQAAAEGRDPVKIAKPGRDEGNKRSFVNINLFDLSSYDDDTRQIEFILDERSLVYVYALKQNFTGYHLRHIKKMRSQHSIRLYEIMRSYLSLKYVTEGYSVITRTIPYAELRNMLGLYETEYKKWYDFERRVLKVAKNELADTDLDFTWVVPERKGVKGSKVPVRNVAFTIHARKIRNPVRLEIADGWRNQILAYVPESTLEKFVKQYNEDRVQRNAEEVLQRIEDGKAINNVPAYLRTLIERDAAGSQGATNPYSYSEGPERNFVNEVLLPLWPSLPRDVADQFITHRLRKGKIADMYKEYANLTDQVSEKDKKKALREKLRDIGDLDW